MRKLLMKTALSVGAYVAVKRTPYLNSFVFGNLPKFAATRSVVNPQSPLYGKRIAFLGSSITYDAAAHGDSFVDFLVAQDGVIATKEAVSGTTLAGTGPKTYVSRLRQNIPVDQPLDLFVCQLSTNDGRQGIPLGERTPANQRDGFDATTTLGAIEDILAYVHQRWQVPVVFYTCLRKPDSDYAELVAQLKLLQAKWGFHLINLWQDPVVHAENQAQPLAMFDDAHPTRLGYRNIWTPIFRQALTQVLP